MRYLGLSVALALAACGSGSNGGAEPVASGKASAPAVTSAAADEATALLDQLSRPQAKGKYAPRDDCAKVPGLAEFRHKLAEAVLNNDAAGVAALASKDVKLGFAGDDGSERFLAQLKDPKGELMAEIKRLLPLGCSVDTDGNMTAPWYFAQDMGDIDGYAATIVTGEDVPLYEKADAKSAVKQRISWDVVLLNDGLYPERPFQLVEAPGGAKGYMPTDKLRSLLDYRLLAVRENGQWKISAILAGD
jgi:hypothetical protein